MKAYTVHISGCDDSTTAQVDLTDAEAAAVAKVARAITATSDYGCMPTMFIAPGIHEYIDETPEDL